MHHQCSNNISRMNITDRTFINCVKNDDLVAVTKLLENGANVHARYDRALRYSAECGRLRMVSKLLEHGADVHAEDDYALRYSAENGYALVVSKLLEHGADVHARNGNALM